MAAHSAGLRPNPSLNRSANGKPPGRGHEFLDAIRSDNVWAKTKETFTEQGISMTSELVKAVAKTIEVPCQRGVHGPTA